MNPNDPNTPTPQPEQQPQPTPPVAPVPPTADQSPFTAPAPATATPPAYGQTPVPSTPKKKKTPVVIAIVVGVLLLGVLLTSAVRSALDIAGNVSDIAKGPDTVAPAADDAEEEAKPVVPTEAKYTTDFRDVCDNTATITNATANQKPYKVAPFYRTALDKWGESMFSRESGLRVEAEEFQTINTVACLDVIESTLAKATTCDYKGVSVELYTLEYSVTYRDPTTGKEVAKGSANVPGSDTKCPSFVGYKKDDPRYYAIPDKTSLDAVVGAFVNS